MATILDYNGHVVNDAPEVDSHEMEDDWFASAQSIGQFGRGNRRQATPKKPKHKTYGEKI